MNWYRHSMLREAVVSPETAKSLNIQRKLPKDENFARAVQNTPGAKITKDGLELEVTRNQHPNQAETAAVRSGIFYQPTGSASKYPYSGKGGYGGLEEIKGITLFRRPIFVKGATGGKAPQMAYDLIKGKGAYEKMRREVLDTVVNLMWYQKPEGGKFLEAIHRVLEKYSGDVHLVNEIRDLDFIAKGNNVPYAIQENIVACAVRDAGYDSVIGYSLKKDGTPFLSEVFDVREITYPSRWKPQGRIHETLLVPEKIQATGSCRNGCRI